MSASVNSWDCLCIGETMTCVFYLPQIDLGNETSLYPGWNKLILFEKKWPWLRQIDLVWKNINYSLKME